MKSVSKNGVNNYDLAEATKTVLAKQKKQYKSSFYWVMVVMSGCYLGAFAGLKSITY
jgi:hypothetical protein